MHIFYSPYINEDNFSFDEEESRHAIKVLRLKERDSVVVVDGKGGFYKAEITKADAKKCVLKILSSQKEYGKQKFEIHIAIAPTKNMDRIEWFIEKSVEFGIDKISFILCERSERKNINLERVNKIAVSAMKQSLRAYLPEINELHPFKGFVKTVSEDQKFIAHLESGEKKELQNTAQKRGKYCILIGPEGDFSPNEIKESIEAGFIPVNLGSSRLRTETAGIAACHILNLINSSES